MPRMEPRNISIPILLLAGLLVLSGETCGKTEEGCRAEPLGYVNVFFRTGEPDYPRSLTAAVVAFDPASHTLALSDSNAAADTLYLDVPGGDLPFETGKTYTFDVDYAPGFPSLSGVIVRDSEGLLFAGITDRASSPRIFQSGIPGFGVSLTDADCPDRNSDPCYDAIHNANLGVRHDGQSAALKNREAARLGDYDVTCLAASRIDYSSSCADAGLPSYSFILVRHGAVPDQDSE